MASAIANEKNFLEKLVATNVKQAANIAKQDTPIHTLTGEVKKIQLKLANRGGRGVKSDNIRKCLKYGYFWSQGYNLSHMRPDWKNLNEVHRDKATHTNTMKVTPFNKGWDE